MYLQTQHFLQMNYFPSANSSDTITFSTTKEMTVTKSLKLLRDGFKSEFADFVYADQRMTDLLQELSSEFVDANIPLIDEDNQVELAMMLMETLNITAR